jgi:hypothetical protein
MEEKESTGKVVSKKEARSKRKRVGNRINERIKQKERYVGKNNTKKIQGKE